METQIMYNDLKSEANQLMDSGDIKGYLTTLLLMLQVRKELRLRAMKL